MGITERAAQFTAETRRRGGTRGEQQINCSARVCASARLRGEERRSSRGSALLAVLWLSAALAAIAFSLSSTVRSETEHTSTLVDGLRAYYLAQGGIHRAAMELLWGANSLAPGPIPRGTTEVNYVFPSGHVRVEIIPETAKLDVNHATIEDLFRLGLALGVDPDRAREIAAGIDDWRKPAPPQGSPFDLYYASRNPSFRAAHASFQEIEELLLVKGITPELFFGTYVREATGSPDAPLVPRAGLADCLSVYGSGNQVDANTAAPPVLAAVGLAPEAIQALVARRRAMPFTDPQLRAFLTSLGAPGGRLRVGGNSIFLLRATARLRLPDGQHSDLRRTVAAQVKYMPSQYAEPINFLRWYDNAWSH